MKSILKYLLAVLLVLGGAMACAEKQDFNQFDDLSIIPTVEASLVYIESPERLINTVTGVNFYSQVFNFDAFNEQFVADRVVDGVITYEVENTTSKELNIMIEFLDEAGNSLDLENFDIDPAPTAILRREIAYGTATGRSLDILRNTSNIRVSATNLGDNSSVSTLPDPRIILRSSAQLRIRLK